MKRIYLDNAATTPVAPEVIDAMLPFLRDTFGNPSSTHWHGRQARAAIERVRKQIAGYLGASPAEIIFTSGGTEADNCAIRSAVRTHGLQHVITSPTEHHAVLHTVEDLAAQGVVKMHLLQVDEQGRISLHELKQLLEKHPKALVSLMHGNNEIGTLNPIEEIADICKHYGAFYHCDTVQTMAHYPIDVSKIPIDYLAGSGHKFHAPKGIGFMYMRKKSKVHPLITGGAQERNMRGGTENVAGIVALGKAMELAQEHMQAHARHIRSVKQHMIELLRAKIPGVSFNGTSADIDNSLYTVLSISLPPSPHNDMLLFHLDLQGISASGGSACSSGAVKGSHVLAAIKHPAERGAIRFSFSRYTTREEVEHAVNVLQLLLSTDNPVELVRKNM
ncbi:cysteine desulfurase family protein [Thermonema rossianum]|uniref:cysteine desulfurase family protein n=1 Tax=Thermonema rossianum TaxID=55505 RepID=UPI000571CCF3|nr:cysteine desulfurase family protein [Thermonema rossianum]